MEIGKVGKLFPITYLRMTYLELMITGALVSVILLIFGFLIKFSGINTELSIQVIFYISISAGLIIIIVGMLILHLIWNIEKLYKDNS